MGYNYKILESSVDSVRESHIHVVKEDMGYNYKILESSVDSVRESYLQDCTIGHEQVKLSCTTLWVWFLGMVTWI